MTQTGRIVIITGSTGSGKTTTCKAFVDRMDELWLHFGIDLFLGSCVPRKFVDGGSRSADGVHFLPDDPADPTGPWHMDMGTYGLGLVASFHRMAAEAVRSGQNVVLDHIATVDPPLLADCVDVFRDLPVFFVGLRPPAEVIPERIDGRLEQVAAVLGHEQAVRNSENKKLVARYLYDRIFANDLYDLEIDTNRHDPGAVVELIAGAMGDGRGTAFPELARRLDAGLAPFGR
jgi:chloramphenicol 3-O-phosphotransferase